MSTLQLAMEDLAAAARILAAQGVVDAFGHVSMRHPARKDRYLMARAMAPALVRPEDILEYDLDSTALNAVERSSFLERFIHGEIYKARADVNAVVHSHSPSVVPFGLVDVRMQAMFHNAAFLAAGVPVWDIAKEFGPTDMLVRDSGIGRSLARTLADKPVVLMRGHGDVTVGPDVKIAVFRAYYTDVNARLQSQAIGLGTDVTYLSAEEGAKADTINLAVIDRIWNRWKLRVQALGK